MHVIDDFELRHLPFERCWNFRDIGGYPTSDGRSLAWKRYFRSGALEDMHEADRQRLRTLGIRTIVDLRRPEETANLGARGVHPAAELGARYAHLPPLPDGASAELDERFGRAISGQRYLGYLDYAGPSIRAIFEVLADPESYPLVMHCTAGKDRTGVTTAMALDLAGVAREVIEADFELTNRDTARWLTWSAASGFYNPDGNPDEERRRFGVPAEAIGVFLDGLDERYGGVRGYLGSLGLGDDVFAAIRENLVEAGGTSGIRETPQGL